MKAILVRNEMPTCCGDCEFCADNTIRIGVMCVAADCRDIDGMDADIDETKPVWCPWRPAPERRHQTEEGDYAVGWNDALRKVGL